MKIVYNSEQMAYLSEAENLKEWHRLRDIKNTYPLKPAQAKALVEIYEDAFKRPSPFCEWCPSDQANLIEMVYREYDKQPGAILESLILAEAVTTVPNGSLAEMEPPATPEKEKAEEIAGISDAERVALEKGKDTLAIDLGAQGSAAIVTALKKDNEVIIINAEPYNGELSEIDLDKSEPFTFPDDLDKIEPAITPELHTPNIAQVEAANPAEDTKTEVRSEPKKRGRPRKEVEPKVEA